MSVDAATVRRIAHLARIAVSEDEVPHLQGELNAMLAFVEQLSEVNVEGVEPMTSVTPMQMKKRQDVVDEGFTVEQQGRFVRPNTRPGLGITINENEVKKHPFQQEASQRVFYSDGSVGDW